MEARTINIYCATWNVNGRSPLGFVRPWLSDCTLEDPPDIYAIGFQEVCDYVTHTGIVSEWEEISKASLFPHIKYKKLKTIRMLGILLIVFVKEPLLSHISNVEAQSVSTGLGKVLGGVGNFPGKGAVAIRFDIRKTSLCFVNSHLAHGRKHYERRNQDFHEICLEMSLMLNSAIEDHDMVYWFGDLNYRINKSLTLKNSDQHRDMVKSLIYEGNYSELLDADQLKEQQLEGRVFVGYNEGSIKFQPTYKYDIGTNEWDTSKHKRTPAWTDRILWKGGNISQLNYESIQTLKVSDHKPVFALFQAKISLINEEKQHKILNDVYNNFTNMEYKHLPRIRINFNKMPLDFNILHFDTIKFNESQTKRITIENISEVPAKFILKKNDIGHRFSQSGSISRPWLVVTPLKGMIPPNENCNLDVKVHLKSEQARKISLHGETKLNDTIIIRVPNLPDTFITVTGTYHRSSFGMSMDALCKINVPVASMPSNDILELDGKCDKTVTFPPVEEKGEATKWEEYENKLKNQHDFKTCKPHKVPKEIRSLCRLLQELDCFHTPKVFQKLGMPEEFIALRDWIDAGLPGKGPTVSVHTVAETLLIFLDSLNEPLIPFEFFHRCLEKSCDFNETQTILALLPTHHKNVFNHIRYFLHQILRHSSTRYHDEQMLAKIFGNIVLRDNECVECKITGQSACCMHGTSVIAMTKQRLMENQKTSFMYQFLRNK